MEVPVDDPCACFRHGFEFTCRSMRHCGTYFEFSLGEMSPNDPCAAEMATDDPAACEQLMADNAGVVACVAESAAGGAPFRFEHERNMGSAFALDADYWLPGDDLLLVSRHEAADQCESEVAATYRAPALGGCDDWPCIEAALRIAVELEVCTEAENCDGI